MPLPRTLARLNRRLTNRLAGRFAGRLPPFAIVAHTGRRSGRAYQTPLWAFRAADGFVVALTYGDSADWVRNVLAAGACRLEWAGKWWDLTSPTVLDGHAGRRLMPAILRPVLRLLGVNQYLTLRPALRPS